VGTLPSPTSPERTIRDEAHYNRFTQRHHLDNMQVSGIEGSMSVSLPPPVTVSSPTSEFRHPGTEESTTSTSTRGSYPQGSLDGEENITHRFELNVGNGQTATLEVHAGEERDIQGLAQRFVSHHRLRQARVPVLSDWLRRAIFSDRSWQSPRQNTAVTFSSQRTSTKNSTPKSAMNLNSVVSAAVSAAVTAAVDAAARNGARVVESDMDEEDGSLARVQESTPLSFMFTPSNIHSQHGQFRNISQDSPYGQFSAVPSPSPSAQASSPVKSSPRLFSNLSTQPSHTGWIHKSAPNTTSFNRRFFALWNDEKLYYFRSGADCFAFFNKGKKNKKGEINLKEVTHISEVETHLSVLPNNGKAMKLHTASRIWLLCPESAEEFRHWSNLLRTIIERYHSAYSMHDHGDQRMPVRRNGDRTRSEQHQQDLGNIQQSERAVRFGQGTDALSSPQSLSSPRSASHWASHSPPRLRQNAAGEGRPRVSIEQGSRDSQRRVLLRRFDLNVGYGQTASLDVYKGDENDTLRLAQKFVQQFDLPRENIATLSEWLDDVLPSGGIEGNLYIPEQHRGRGPHSEGKQYTVRGTRRYGNGDEDGHSSVARAHARNAQGSGSIGGVPSHGIGGAPTSSSGPRLVFRNRNVPLRRDLYASPSLPSSSSWSPSSSSPSPSSSSASSTTFRLQTPNLVSSRTVQSSGGISNRHVLATGGQSMLSAQGQAFEGWLMWSRDACRTWERKYFCLSSSQLLYRDANDDDKLAANLDGIISVRASIKRTRCIELHSYFSTDTTTTTTNVAVVYLRAPTREAYTHWVRVITDQVFHHNLETSKVTGDPELMRVPANVRATHLMPATVALLRLQYEASRAPWQIRLGGEEGIVDDAVFARTRTCKTYLTWLHPRSEQGRPRVATRHFFELCENGELLRSQEQQVHPSRALSMSLFVDTNNVLTVLCVEEIKYLEHSHRLKLVMLQNHDVEINLLAPSGQVAREWYMALTTHARDYRIANSGAGSRLEYILARGAQHELQEIRSPQRQVVEAQRVYKAATGSLEFWMALAKLLHSVMTSEENLHRVSAYRLFGTSFDSGASAVGGRTKFPDLDACRDFFATIWRSGAPMYQAAIESLALVEDLVVGANARRGSVDRRASASALTGNLLTLHTENWRASILSMLETRNAKCSNGLGLDNSVELWICAGLEPEEHECRHLHEHAAHALMASMEVTPRRYLAMLLSVERVMGEDLDL
jgi:hypothetical protein